MADPELVIAHYLESLEAGDADAVRELFADDATWTLAAGELPIAGEWEGRDAILDEFLATAMSYYQPGSASFEVTGMVSDGSRVVLMWTSRARTLADLPHENECIGVFTIVDGRIQSVREWMDTLYAHDRAFASVSQETKEITR